MAFNEKISDRIREALENLPAVEEKRMFGGVCYMVGGKMCIGVVKNDMMCRIGTEVYEEALAKRGCREMDFAGKPMEGYVYVSADGMQTNEQFEYWISLCLAYNPKAKAAKKKASK
ncbi:MAG: TfoX/Sxy family protein [Bacteroidetes bacterium]|nr:TfoX/Sxy family protein [Bacteroidota bacterium]